MLKDSAPGQQQRHWTSSRIVVWLVFTLALGWLGYVLLDSLVP